jgi:hypothetical protein
VIDAGGRVHPHDGVGRTVAAAIFAAMTRFGDEQAAMRVSGLSYYLKFDANFAIGSPNHSATMKWKSACGHADRNSIGNVFRRLNGDSGSVN